MMGLGYGGAVYNHYVAKLMDTPTDELRQDVESWDNSSFAGKIFKAVFHPRYDERRLEAVRDIVAAREDPSSPQAKKVNWRIDAYRKRQAERQGRSRISNFLLALVGE